MEWAEVDVAAVQKPGLTSGKTKTYRLLNLEAIAEAYLQLHLQHRSAWTQELDLRPYKEPV